MSKYRKKVLVKFISNHASNIIFVTIGYIASMLLVKHVIVPVQQSYLPMVTTFAALIFPLHGVRVLAAWLFGWKSILYLFVANTIMHFTLTPDNELTLKSMYAWLLVSSVAWATFSFLKFIGIGFTTKNHQNSFSMWKFLLLVGFVSSFINSLGHNIICLKTVFPHVCIYSGRFYRHIFKFLSVNAYFSDPKNFEVMKYFERDWAFGFLMNPLS